jgi:anti-anti-sigma factor
MELTGQKKENFYLLSIKGKLDSNSSAEAEAEIIKILEEEENLLIDLSELRYVSSAGLRVFLITAKQVKGKNGKLKIAAMGHQVHDVFNIAGFLPLYSIYKSVEEAEAAF